MWQNSSASRNRDAGVHASENHARDQAQPLCAVDEIDVEALVPSACFAWLSGSAFDTNAATPAIDVRDLLRRSWLRLPRLLTLLDQLPEFARLAQLRVFRNGQFAAKKEIEKRVLVQNAIDLDTFVGLREINTVIFRAITIQFFPRALDHAKPLRIELIQILRQNLELRQQLKLQLLRERGDLGGAQFIKNNLEHWRSNINPPHPRANAGNNFPWNGAGFLSEFRAGDFLTPIAPHENNVVTGSHTLDVAYVDHHQIHCYPANNRAALTPHQDGRVAVRKMPWIPIGVTGC